MRILTVEEFPALKGISLYWLAGVLEGEGSFKLKITRRSNSIWYGIEIAVGMTDEDVIREIHKLSGCGVFGGPYYPKTKHHKPYWTWCACGRDAYALMKIILPLMKYRRSRKIEQLLSTYERNREEGIKSRAEYSQRRRDNANT